MRQPPEPKKILTHLDEGGDARMVDVSDKSPTVREAVAAGVIRMKRETLEAIESGNAPKGDVLTTAKLAGILAAKQTSQLIPLCHPLPLTKIDVRISLDSEIPGYRLEATVKTKAETGVEMEALTAVSVAALTLYDMAKALEKTMEIEGIRLVKKTGGTGEGEKGRGGDKEETVTC
ncbi:cyclic pyranopterin monophosphate synthase accessory protein [Leptolyngbya valderiana BDU 20041]|nr:cyclic pyranopterin monophosphate synthase accessory protein [Leptolyngbya valderiana BDU 20041]